MVLQRRTRGLGRLRSRSGKTRPRSKQAGPRALDRSLLVLALHRLTAPQLRVLQSISLPLNLPLNFLFAQQPSHFIPRGMTGTGGVTRLYSY